MSHWLIAFRSKNKPELPAFSDLKEIVFLDTETDSSDSSTRRPSEDLSVCLGGEGEYGILSLWEPVIRTHPIVDSLWKRYFPGVHNGIYTRHVWSLWAAPDLSIKDFIVRSNSVIWLQTKKSSQTLSWKKLVEEIIQDLYPQKLQEVQKHLAHLI